MLRNLALAGLSAGLAVSLAACGGQSSSTSTSTTTTTESAGKAASGNLTAAGSTALLPLVKQAAVDYQAAHPDVKIAVSGGGSRVGITQAAQGGVDIGDSDIPAKDPSLVDHKVAVVSFAVVTNPAAGVKNLTTQQIRDIFGGKVTNFKQVGGKDQAISIINRPASSGTRAVFVQNVMGGTQPSASGLTQDSSGTVAQLVAQTPGAISYVSTGYVKPGQHVAVSIDGVTPTDDNVKSGKYKFWSYEHMLTKGQPKAGAGDFITFVTGDKSLLASLHFIPVGDMKAK